MKENEFNAFATFTAICSAASSLLFGLLCIYFGFKTKDMWYAPFALLGIVGSMVMYANRK